MLFFLPRSFAFLSSPHEARRVYTSRLREATETIEPASDGESEKANVDEQEYLDDIKIGNFELTTALFCGGLAFDAYVEPPENSSRWEKGSQGLKVAFVSQSFTRQLYKGLVEVTVQRCDGLPEDENSAERLLSGKGADACVLVAALEGAWKEDIQMLEKELYHEGVMDLGGAAHVGRSSTAWASNNENLSKNTKKKTGKAPPYHIPATWNNGGQAVWPEEPPFYIYVQDPSTTRIVVTILDQDKLGFGKPVGSTHKRLSALIPASGLTQEQLMTKLKQEYLDKINSGEIEDIENANFQIPSQQWEGTLRMTSKPRKKDKNSQIMAGAAAGAAFAGPAGAAAGALIGSLYEGQIQGSATLKLKYLPIPQTEVPRKVYNVLGGMPGIDWGSLLSEYQSRKVSQRKPFEELVVAGVQDLEHCFFVNHDNTGATCSVYRSLEQKLVIVSFRGTCEPIDLITDASIVQQPWVEGEDPKKQGIPKVHVGFRGSLNSISRRLKELILATPGPGERLSDYDMIVTGHSLGGALATLFVTDVGEYGFDAGRALPQSDPSDAWWKGIADTLMGKSAQKDTLVEPPRPKSLRVYTFGSPRVGNDALSDLFSSLVDNGLIDQAYRVVNGDDVVARMPRTVNALIAEVGYEHCGSTVLINPSPSTEEKAVAPVWVEGESDDSKCPVRDGVMTSSPLAEGTLLSDLKGLVATDESSSENTLSKLASTAAKVTQRVQSISSSDLGSVLGLNREFTDRELKMIQALAQGKALAHHMEDEYYAGMGRAVGLKARVGEDIAELTEEV